MQEKQWQYGLTFAVSLLLVAMPWLLKFHTDLPVRSWDFYVVGLVTAGSAAAALHFRSGAASWLTPSLGLWMFFSPWVLGFVSNIAARNSAWVLGGFIFLLSGWALLERLFAGRSAHAELWDRA